MGQVTITLDEEILETVIASLEGELEDHNWDRYNPWWQKTARALQVLKHPNKCPMCLAVEGEPCTTAKGHERTPDHKSRIAARTKEN